MDKEYYIDDPHMVSPDNIGSGYAVWSTLWETKYQQNEEYQNGLFSDLMQFDISTGFTMVQQNDDLYKCLVVTTPKENQYFHSKVLSSLNNMKKYFNYLDKELSPIRAKMSSLGINLINLKGEGFYSQEGAITPKADEMMQQLRFLKQLGIIDFDISNTKPHKARKRMHKILSSRKICY